MELIKETNIDFIGRRFLFIGISVLLLVAGIGSLIANGGPKFGIDFKGGTLVYAKFKDAPDTGRIRQALEAQGLNVSTLQPFLEAGGTPELKIDLDLAEGVDINSGREQIATTLGSLYSADASKLDLNNTGPSAIAQLLSRNNELASAGVTTSDIDEGARAIVDARTADHQGLFTDFEQLASVPGVNADMMTALRQDAYLGGFAIRGVEVVGPKIGQDLQDAALLATAAALGAMLVYIAFRFEWVFGVAAVLAVFHDVFITVGFFSLFGREIDLTVIAALLTLVGYSMNDTIVIFDRVRENRKLTRREPMDRLLNKSINQTLARSVLTSGLTFIAVLCLYLFGGEVLRGFSFALVVGVVVGSYSSIFIASPIVLWWQQMTAGKGAVKRGSAAA